jgi:hypothetical protein
LDERNGERYKGKQRTLEQLVKEKLGMQEIQGHIDYVTRLGKNKGNRPIFVKVTTFSKKLEVLKYTSKLAGVEDQSGTRLFYRGERNKERTEPKRCKK